MLFQFDNTVKKRGEGGEFYRKTQEVVSLPKAKIPYFYSMLHQHSNKDLYLRIRALAREMRKNQTPAEDFFWEKVRARRLFGLKWNRQFIIPCPIDGSITKYYISDFHCNQYKLIVEIDGEIHLQQEEEDLIRTDRMGEYGYTVIRFSNDQVLNHWTEVEMMINEFIHGD